MDELIRFMGGFDQANEIDPVRLIKKTRERIGARYGLALPDHFYISAVEWAVLSDYSRTDIGSGLSRGGAIRIDGVKIFRLGMGAFNEPTIPRFHRG